MQQIDVIHEVDANMPTPERILEYEQANEEDFITDEAEIRGIIRRAVTLAWEDSVFTLDELHGRLINNFVKYPVPEGEEHEWLESVVYDLWRTQKEMARIAGGVMPTIVNTKIEGKRHFGILQPALESEPAYAEPSLHVVAEERPETVAEPPESVVAELLSENADTTETMSPEIVEVTELDIAPVLLRPSEIATRIFQEYIGSRDERPQYDNAYLMGLFKENGVVVQAKDIREVIKGMADSGYVHSYTTGKNKTQRTWWTMDADVKTDVLADIEDGSFYESLSGMFDDEEAVA